MKFLTPLSLAALLVFSLVGCATVGPDYAGAPALPAGTDHFVRNHEATARETLRAAPWWEQLGDADLTRLIQRALADSPDLQAAQARLVEAGAGLEQAEANGRPKASASFLSGGLDQAPNTDQQTIYRVYAGSALASWEPDLFGGTRRSVESASANRDAVFADLADAQLALAAQIASQYVQLRGIQIQEQIVASDLLVARDALELTSQRRALGVAATQEVDQRISQQASMRAQASQLQSDRLVALDRLALLCGQVPGALDQTLGGDAALPALPATIEIGDPATQLRHRPDVRAAERRLAASTAQIGVQTANYFPKVTLLGGGSLMSTDASALFQQSRSSLLGGLMLSWDFLDFNRTASAVSQATGARDEALANYRGSVLRALNDANSALTRYHQQNQIGAQKAVRLASAQQQLALTTQRRSAGVASRVELLDARQTLDDARVQDLSARTELLDDYILLQKSLGMGWTLAESTSGT